MHSTRLVLLLVASTLLVACSTPPAGGGAGTSSGTGPAASATVAPVFVVDPFWPKALPNGWVLGATIGVAVDARDNVWVIHRPQTVEDNLKAAAVTPPVGTCCTPAPPVLQFDRDGNLIGHWGGPGNRYQWPESNHGIAIDHKGNVWIGGNGETDTHVLKFDAKGQFLLQIGRQGVHNGSNDPEHLWRAAKIFIDPSTNEAYIADGYGNHRVVVFDADSGKYKRHWGAYGERPDDTDLGPYVPGAPPVRQFRTVHCANVSHDQLVYVCDRVNNRIQVFRTDGTFVQEATFEPATLRSGSVWDLAFSRDADEKYLYLADGLNERIRILDRRTLAVLTAFGDGGRQPGQFFGVHNLAVDSQGNLFTAETYTGARVQRFVYKGVAPVRAADQGVVWPGR